MLTARDLTVTKAMLSAEPVNNIAQRLRISRQTVRQHFVSTIREIANLPSETPIRVSDYTARASHWLRELESHNDRL